MEPDQVSISDQLIEKSTTDIYSTSTLEELFNVGYTTSENILIYRDEEKDVEIRAQFRTLTPVEIREIAETTARYSSVLGSVITEQIETLIRSTKIINGMPLMLDPKELSAFFDKNKRNPSPQEQARDIFYNKIKSMYIINAMYDAFKEFEIKVQSHFEDIKKKLKNQNSSK
jgi:formate dehydrogenase assembly factor FdhD